MLTAIVEQIVVLNGDENTRCVTGANGKSKTIIKHESTIRTNELAINVEWSNKSSTGAEAESETVLAVVCCFYCFDRMHGRHGGGN
jgi:hypothetical protein